VDEQMNGSIEEREGELVPPGGADGANQNLAIVPPAVGDVVELRVFCKHDVLVQIAVNVFHFEVTAIQGLGSSYFSFANRISTNISGIVKDMMSIDCRYAFTGVNRVKPLPPSTPEYSAAGQGVGAQVGKSLPPQVCGIITKNTPIGGPGGRGRVYAPFPAEIHVAANGKPTNAYFNLLLAYGAEVLKAHIIGEGVDTVSYRPVLLKRSVMTVTPITAHQARSKWGTQRRRSMYSAINRLPGE